jgi:hypothetical protein
LDGLKLVLDEGDLTGMAAAGCSIPENKKKHKS